MRDGGGWGADGGLKQPFKLNQQCCAFNMWHKLIQFTKLPFKAVWYHI